MALSVVDIYRKILPKTNCKDCGYLTCMAFASMVVSEKLPLDRCPHIPADVAAHYQPELLEQYRAGKWTKRDPAQDALVWARERAASMNMADLPGRIGGQLTETDDGQCLALPYFQDVLLIDSRGIRTKSGEDLNRWEQVFIYNHLAQGGRELPTGRWIALEEIPNTVSKIKSMREHVEIPLQEHFSGRLPDLREAAKKLGGREITGQDKTVQVVHLFQPLPRIPVQLSFWDADPSEGFDAKAGLLFDETITRHLDIESIIFLSEQLSRRLMGETDSRV